MSCLNLYKIRLSDKSKFIVKHKYASVNSEDINMTFIFRLLQIQMEKNPHSTDCSGHVALHMILAHLLYWPVNLQCLCNDRNLLVIYLF